MDLDYNICQEMNSKSFKDEESLEKHFIRIAYLLLNKVILIVDENQYRLTEIEFYFFNATCHEDPYIHKDEMQLNPNQWYFHGSGLDITFGDGINYGGVLIRGIKQLNCGDQGFTNGPLRVVKEVFRSFGNICINDHKLHLSKAIQLDEVLVMRSARVGLKDKNDNNAGRYKEKKYRFLTFPFDKNHNYSEKTKVAQAMLADGKYSKEIINNEFEWSIIK